MLESHGKSHSNSHELSPTFAGCPDEVHCRAISRLELPKVQVLCRMPLPWAGADWVSDGSIRNTVATTAARSPEKSRRRARGAIMATLRCDHPDIEEFVTAKQVSGRLRRFNFSVQITEALIAAVLGSIRRPRRSRGSVTAVLRHGSAIRRPMGARR